MSSRREFLKTGFRGASLIALSPTVPRFLAGTALARRLRPMHESWS